MPAFLASCFTSFRFLFFRVVSDKPKEEAKTEEKGKPVNDKKDGDKDRGANKENRRSRSLSAGRRRRRSGRSPTPKPLRIHIGRLTRNVTKDHLSEIFSAYGTVKAVEMSKERAGMNHMHRGFAYVEYATAEEAETAMKHMDGGACIWSSIVRFISWLRG